MWFGNSECEFLIYVPSFFGSLGIMLMLLDQHRLPENTVCDCLKTKCAILYCELMAPKCTTGPAWGENHLKLRGLLLSKSLSMQPHSSNPPQETANLTADLGHNKLQVIFTINRTFLNKEKGLQRFPGSHFWENIPAVNVFFCNAQRVQGHHSQIYSLHSISLQVSLGFLSHPRC